MLHLKYLTIIICKLQLKNKTLIFYIIKIHFDKKYFSNILMAYNVTSEWEDIHVKLKNYLPREKEPTTDEIEKIAIEVAEKYEPLEHKKLEELNELDDDDYEDDVIKQYKEKRMAELKEFASKPKFGSVTELRKQDYITEVNNAPKDVFVVLHLYQTYVTECNVLNKVFDYLAQKFVLVKFMRIVATNCVENFQDEDCPTVFIYKNGTMFKQFLRASYFFGGKNIDWKSIILLILEVEWVLSSIGILKSELLDDPFEQNEFKPFKKDKIKRDDESDDEDRDDREYSWRILKK